MGISRKLVLGILMISCCSLLAVGSLIYYRAASNNNDIVEAILATVQKQQENSAQALDQGFSGVDWSLAEANAKTMAIMVDLYKNSYQTLARAVSNQIFPMIEGFDFDGAGGVIKTLLAQAPAIKWVQLQTKEEAAASDLFKFGEKQAEGADFLLFEHQVKNDFAFLKLEMQVSMAEMAALAEVKGILDQISTDNQALSAGLKKSFQENLVLAQAKAETDSEDMNARLLQQILLVVILALLVTSGILTVFVRRWIITPINCTISGLRENSELVSEHAHAMSASSAVVADAASQQALRSHRTERTSSVEKPPGHDSVRPGKPNPLHFQQGALHGDAALEAAQGAVSADGAVAGDDDGKGVVGQGRAHRPGAPGIADMPGIAKAAEWRFPGRHEFVFSRRLSAAQSAILSSSSMFRMATSSRSILKMPSKKIPVTPLILEGGGVMSFSSAQMTSRTLSTRMPMFSELLRTTTISMAPLSSAGSMENFFRRSMTVAISPRRLITPLT